MLRNNSAADGDVSLNTTYGITCNKPSMSDTLTWYNPRGGEVMVSENSGDIRSIVFSRELAGTDPDQEIRRSTNFKDENNGVYTCNITDQNGESQFLYIAIYETIPSEFTMVNLDVTCFEDSEGAVLELNCPSSALPATNNRWYFNDQLISVGEQVQYITNRTTVTYNSLLRIRGHELTGGDMLGVGQYRCSLESGATSVNVTRMLRISKEMPKLPHNLQIQNHSLVEKVLRHKMVLVS